MSTDATPADFEIDGTGRTANRETAVTATRPPDLQNVLSRLRDVTEVGDGYKACCPAHDDRKPSLSISTGEDGRILLFCRSGSDCTAEKIVGAIGLTLADLMPQRDKPKPKAKKKDRGDGFSTARHAMAWLKDKNGEPAGVWNYRDATGEHVGSAVRFNEADGGKSFRPISLIGKGWYIEQMPKPRPLYRLTKLPSDKTRRIRVTEGEKCADAVADIGLPVVSFAGGSSAPQYTDWKPLADFMNVVLLPDKGDTGAACMNTIAAILTKQNPAATVQVLDLPGLAEGEDVYNWIERGGTAEQFTALEASDAKLWEPPPPKPSADAGRMRIEVTPDEMEVNDQAVASLANDEGVYQRSGSLVRVMIDTAQQCIEGITRAAGSPRIDFLPEPTLRERLAAQCYFYKVRQTKEGPEEIQIPPPTSCIKAVAARGDWSSVRHLEGVINSPVLRRDGSILVAPGYDAKTGLLLMPGGTSIVLPEKYDYDAAIAARDALLEVVCDFPFETGAHRAAWLAYLLTPLARHAFDGPSPLFVIDGNVAGAGKSLLSDACSIIVAGRAISRTPWSDSDAEVCKKITAIAIAGDRMILIDNVSTDLGCPSLDAALTGTSWRDRILGRSEMTPELPLVVTWAATGNNIVLRGDTTRRTCHIRLETSWEEPSQRPETEFKHPTLKPWVSAERPRLLSAGLTILAAYYRAGRPSQNLPSWGSFEGWSDLVRQAIVWTDLPDPGITREELAAVDTGATKLRTLLAALAEIYPEGISFTSRSLLDLIYSTDPYSDITGVRYKAARDAVADLCECKSGVQAEANPLGAKLRGFKGRVVNGMRITSKHGHANKAEWQIERTASTQVTLASQEAA